MQLLCHVVAVAEDNPYPVYLRNELFDLIAWNPASCEWYDDRGSLDGGDRNLLQWLLTAPRARERLVDCETITRDLVARFRSECGNRPGDPHPRLGRQTLRIVPMVSPMVPENGVVFHMPIGG